jgi:predicted O-methyltransferase YrrM
MVAGSGIRYERQGRAPSVPILELYPELAKTPVRLGDVTFRPAGMDPTDLYCLAALATIRQPTTIFEFGTYEGATTRHLAAAAPAASIWTIDLPEDVPAPLRSDPSDPFLGVGYRFSTAPEEQRITQLYGDTQTFDFTPWQGQMDFIVVDASHGYDGVKADSENALRMLGPSGLIVWDDYCPLWATVVRAVDDFAREHRLTVVRLASTEIAIYDRSMHLIEG